MDETLKADEYIEVTIRGKVLWVNDDGSVEIQGDDEAGRPGHGARVYLRPENAVRIKRIPEPLPIDPGTYRDRLGDLWLLSEDGNWDALTFTDRDLRHRPVGSLGDVFRNRAEKWGPFKKVSR